MNGMNGKNTEKKNLKVQAYNTLKNKIVTCEYAPGSMLNEAQLATELGFSRTPIREAISILEMEGFLSIVPKKGILVTDILLSDIVQIFQARMEIEPITLKMAGPHMRKEEVMKWFVSSSLTSLPWIRDIRRIRPCIWISFLIVIILISSI